MVRPTLGDGETVRFQMKIEDEELQRIRAWQFAHHVPSLSEAVRRLCMAAIQKGPAEVAASPSHGPNNPHQEKAMDIRSDTTATAVPAMSDAEHQAWTALDLAVEKARARCDVAFQYAGRMADKEATDGLVQIHHTHLQSFCFMVFETFDALKEAHALADAFYGVGVAPREAA